MALNKTAKFESKRVTTYQLTNIASNYIPDQRTGGQRNYDTKLNLVHTLDHNGESTFRLSVQIKAGNAGYHHDRVHLFLDPTEINEIREAINDIESEVQAEADNVHRLVEVK